MKFAIRYIVVAMLPRRKACRRFWDNLGYISDQETNLRQEARVSVISICLSILSLAVSLWTFWLTMIHRGQLSMTSPTIIFFGYDKVPKLTPKVFLRTLLYSTSTRGQVIEGMYVTVKHAGVERAFSFWGYGETEKLSPGSGLYVGRAGLAANHHFVMSVHEDAYHFTEGNHLIVIFARVVGCKKPIRLGEVTVQLNNELSMVLEQREGIVTARLLPHRFCFDASNEFLVVDETVEEVVPFLG